MKQSSLMQRMIENTTRKIGDVSAKVNLTPTATAPIYIHSNTICYDEINFKEGK